MKKLKLVSAMMCTTMLAACGGSSNDAGSPDTGTPTPPPANTGSTLMAIDGPLALARICFDTNNNGQCDQGEFAADTDSKGELNVSGDDYQDDQPLLAEIVRDKTTDLIRGPVSTSYTLTAPAGSKIVSPFSTILQLLISSGLSSDEAQQTLMEALQAIGTDAELQSLLEQDWTTLTSDQAMRVSRLAESLVDAIANHPDSQEQLLSLANDLAQSLSQITGDALKHFSPRLEWVQGSFTVTDNHRPQPNNTSLTLTAESATESRVDLSGLFSDMDNDALSYSLMSAPSGLTISDHELVINIPQQGSYKALVFASDGHSRSYPVTLEITVDEPAPTPPPASFTGFAMEGFVGRYDSVLVHGDYMYLVYPSADDILYLHQYMGNGEVKSHFFERDDLTFLTSYYDGEKFFPPYNSHATDSRLAVDRFAESEGKYYFATRQGSAYDFIEWEISFANDGTPSLALRDTPQDLICDDKVSLDDLCYYGLSGRDWKTGELLPDGIEINSRYTLFIDGVYYTFAPNKDNSITVTTKSEDSQGLPVYEQTEYPLQAIGEDGRVISEISDANLIYHKELNRLMFYQTYGNSLTGYEFDDMLFGSVDLQTMEFRYATYSIENRDRSKDLAIPTPEGMRVLMSDSILFEFDARDATVTTTEFSYPSGVPSDEDMNNLGFFDYENFYIIQTEGPYNNRSSVMKGVFE